MDGGIRGTRTLALCLQLVQNPGSCFSPRENWTLSNLTNMECPERKGPPVFGVVGICDFNHGNDFFLASFCSI